MLASNLLSAERVLGSTSWRHCASARLDKECITKECIWCYKPIRHQRTVIRGIIAVHSIPVGPQLYPHMEKQSAT